MEGAEAETIRRAVEGDRNAFDALVGPLVDPAFRLAFGLLHDREAAEDAVQESALKAWRKLANLRPGTSIRPWFFAIVGNQCRTTRRGRWWSVLRSEDVGASSTGAEEAAVRGADLRRAIRALAYEQRLALVLYYYLDLSLEEVAAITRAPLGTVKSRVHRAVARLRPQVEAQEAVG